MELHALSPKEQEDGVVIATQREKECHAEGPLSELRPVDRGQGPCGSPAGRELRSTCPPPTPARAPHQPSGVAHRASLVKSKVNKGKDSYHREGELFLSSEYKEKQRKWAGSDWVLLDSKHHDISFT